MKRIYTSIIKEHFEHNEQMIFLAGPRQAGKTTVSLMAKEFSSQFLYLNFLYDRSWLNWGSSFYWEGAGMASGWKQGHLKNFQGSV